MFSRPAVGVGEVATPCFLVAVVDRAFAASGWEGTDGQMARERKPKSEAGGMRCDVMRCALQVQQPANLASPTRRLGWMGAGHGMDE